MRKCFVAMFAPMLFSSVAVADPLTILNSTGDTIYRLYAWPDDLSPRTINILNQPLSSGSPEDIDLDNTYNDCDFTFEIDYNNPADLKRRYYQRKTVEMRYINICGQGNLELLSKDDGM